jgi:hypothetical protein
MKFTQRITLIFILPCLISCSQNNSTNSSPRPKDLYLEYVKKLDSGITDINYVEFRRSLIQSPQFKKVKSSQTQMDSLGGLMLLAAKDSNLKEVIVFSKQILDIDYTNLMAHKMLRQSYEYLGDTINQYKHLKIGVGLLNSILKSGDGKSCNSAWLIVQTTEEGFVIEMIGGQIVNFEKNKNPNCEKFTINNEGKIEEYYFSNIVAQK